MGTPSQNESTGRSNNRWDQKRAGLSALVAALSEVASLRHVQAAAFLERVRRADFDSASKVEQTPTCSTRGNNVRNEIDEARALLLRCEEPDSCQFVVNELLKDLREPSAITRVRKAFEILFEESKCQGVEVDSAVAELFTKVQTRRSSDLMCILRGLISSVAPDKLERIVSTSYNNPFFSDLFPVAKDFLAVAARPGFQTKDSNDRNEGWLLLQKCSEQEKAFILTRIFTVVQSSTFDTDFASLSAISTIVLHQSSLAVTHAAVNRILDTLELRDRAGTLMERVSADRHRSSSTTDAYESPDMRERRGYWRAMCAATYGACNLLF
jgi:hypothetical protein